MVLNILFLTLLIQCAAGSALGYGGFMAQKVDVDVDPATLATIIVGDDRDILQEYHADKTFVMGQKDGTNATKPSAGDLSDDFWEKLRSAQHAIEARRAQDSGKSQK